MKWTNTFIHILSPECEIHWRKCNTAMVNRQWKIPLKIRRLEHACCDTNSHTLVFRSFRRIKIIIYPSSFSLEFKSFKSTLRSVLPTHLGSWVALRIASATWHLTSLHRCRSPPTTQPSLYAASLNPPPPHAQKRLQITNPKIHLHLSLENTSPHSDLRGGKSGGVLPEPATDSGEGSLNHEGQADDILASLRPSVRPASSPYLTVLFDCDPFLRGFPTLQLRQVSELISGKRKVMFVWYGCVGDCSRESIYGRYRVHTHV